MIFYLLFSLSFYIGFEVMPVNIKDFNNHFSFLTKRANELGWDGKFNKFKTYNFSPLFSLKIYENQKKDFGFFISSGFFYDAVKGKFYYRENENEFKIDEKWIYYIFSLNPYWIKETKFIDFSMGYSILFKNLKIYVKGNFELKEDYPKNFKGENIGIYTGIFKRIKKLKIGLLINKFINAEFRKLYKSKDGYIYEGEKPNPEDKRVILVPSNFSLRIMYRI